MLVKTSETSCWHACQISPADWERSMNWQSHLETNRFQSCGYKILDKNLNSQNYMELNTIYFKCVSTNMPVHVSSFPSQNFVWHLPVDCFIISQCSINISTSAVSIDRQRLALLWKIGLGHAWSIRSECLDLSNLLLIFIQMCQEVIFASQVQSIIRQVLLLFFFFF